MRENTFFKGTCYFICPSSPGAIYTNFPLQQICFGWRLICPGKVRMGKTREKGEWLCGGGGGRKIVMSAYAGCNVPKSESCIPRNETARPRSQFLHS